MAVERVREQTARAGDRVAAAAATARDIARRARHTSAARARDLGSQARERVSASLGPMLGPHLCFVASPRRPIPPVIMSDIVRVATYNVHRWQGVNGRTKPDVARAGFVISEFDADVIALQEVLRPFEFDGDDPLGLLCDELDLHLAFAVTRRHRRGQLGNAILSRFPITAISVIDISHSRIERRGALAAQVGHSGAGLGIVATHLSLVDRTRHRQVQTLLDHPQMNSGPAVLMGDMNAWRNCKGSKELELNLNLHHNINWPSSFPSGRPMLALDRIYTRAASVVDVRHHDTPAARKASDHLPVVAEVAVEKAGSEASC
jgi:endonuclease/exonuclease/phosphatase family metal-dependent hydrolase